MEVNVVNIKNEVVGKVQLSAEVFYSSGVMC